MVSKTDFQKISKDGTKIAKDCKEFQENSKISKEFKIFQKV